MNVRFCPMFIRHRDQRRVLTAVTSSHIGGFEPEEFGGTSNGLHLQVQVTIGESPNQENMCERNVGYDQSEFVVRSCANAIVDLDQILLSRRFHNVS